MIGNESTKAICRRLANELLGDQPEYSEQDIEDLANAVQQFVEDWILFDKRLRDGMHVRRPDE